MASILCVNGHGDLNQNIWNNNSIQPNRC